MSEKVNTQKVTTKNTKKSRRGIAMIYGMCAMGALCGMASLAADYGRVQMTKFELRSMADSAARAGAGGLAISWSAAQANAVKFAQSNNDEVLNVDNAQMDALKINAASDIQIGFWNETTHTFTVLSNNDSTANAVHVTLHRTQSRGNAVPLMFGQVLGSTFCDITVDSIAEYIPGVNMNQTVMANANPFLAGAAKGTKASATNPSDRHIPDVAGDSTNWQNSPVPVAIPVSNNNPLSFDSITGTARHDPNLADYQPDGQVGDSSGNGSDIGHNNLTTNFNNNYSSTYYNQNGIADMTAPIDALVGVFLDDSDPSQTIAQMPTNLDYSTDAMRNKTQYTPALRQIFFIGDGLTDDGMTQQKFTPPKGATRLFLATWDFYEWNNNEGSRVVKVNLPPTIKLVK